MNSIKESYISSKVVYYDYINKDKLYNAKKTDLINLNVINNNVKEKEAMERQEQIEYKIRDLLKDSKVNIKNTTPIINNINKQLMQDNLLMKIKIESMKQTCKNISSYCSNLHDQTLEMNNKCINNILKDIFDNFMLEIEKVKED